MCIRDRSTQGEHVDSTQGVYVDSFAGSDSEDAPKDVTPKDGKQHRKKQKVQTYWNHGHRKLLGKKNLRTIKKDRRGVSRCSIWQPHTPLLVGEV